MKLWIVGKNKKRGHWEVQGLFDSEEKAVEACRNRYYFVGPLILNNLLPDDTIKWPGSYYPKYDEK